MHRILYPIAALAMLAGCATTGTTGAGTPVGTALVDTDKALIVADAAYVAAANVAATGVRSGLISGATAVTVGRLSDKAATALHTANAVRTSATVAFAVDAIAAFTSATPKGN